MVLMNIQASPMEIVEAASRITVEDDILFDILYKQPDIAWIMGTNASAILYNETFYNYTGKTPEFMRNWAWQDFLPDEEIARVAGSMYHSLNTGENWECLYPLRSRDKSYRQYLVKAAPLHNKKGDIKYWIGSAMDVTDYIGHAAALPRKRLRRV